MTSTIQPADKYTHNPLWIVHRANTKADLKNIQEMDGIEMDLRMTRDGVIVVRHNRRIQDGNGRSLWIDRVSFDELETISREQIVRFKDILPEIISIAKKKKCFILDLDIKQSGIEKQAYKLLKQYKSFSYLSEIILSSPDIWILQAFDVLDPRFNLALTLSSLSYNDRYDLYELKAIRYTSVVLQFTLKPLIFRILRRKAKKEDIQYANIYHKLIDDNIVKFLHDRGISVLAYSAETKKHIDHLCTLGVDGIKIKK